MKMQSILMQVTPPQAETNQQSLNRTIPSCDVAKTEMQRLATFADVRNGHYRRFSTIRLAGSGCTYNASEGFIECCFCSKITPIHNAPSIQCLENTILFHVPSCLSAKVYIARKKREDHGVKQNIRHLRRFVRHVLPE
ncbi:uncharacterized protein LOC134264129 isoform X2 [Saccostrea cucullata]|uniref:uncharacterized protein LOC134264129 isoform X2 n=1 Tax=Saccostrea cuccullata TaxID=36930 RepID=UPI002ED2A4F6